MAPNLLELDADNLVTRSEFLTLLEMDCSIAGRGATWAGFNPNPARRTRLTRAQPGSICKSSRVRAELVDNRGIASPSVPPLRSRLSSLISPSPFCHRSSLHLSLSSSPKSHLFTLSAVAAPVPSSSLKSHEPALLADCLAANRHLPDLSASPETRRLPRRHLPASLPFSNPNCIAAFALLCLCSALQRARRQPPITHQKGEVKKCLIEVLTELAERHRKAWAAVTDELREVFFLVFPALRSHVPTIEPTPAWTDVSLHRIFVCVPQLNSCMQRRDGTTSLPSAGVYPSFSGENIFSRGSYSYVLVNIFSRSFQMPMPPLFEPTVASRLPRFRYFLLLLPLLFYMPTLGWLLRIKQFQELASVTSPSPSLSVSFTQSDVKSIAFNGPTRLEGRRRRGSPTGRSFNTEFFLLADTERLPQAGNGNCACSSAFWQSQAQHYNSPVFGFEYQSVN
ncbi:hypothetical protein ACLOJK_002002 [Asimina triloba]